MSTRLHATDVKSTAVSKSIENHKFVDEDGEEYKASNFGGFGDYFRRKKIKLQNLDAELRSSSQGKPVIFRGVVAHVNGYTQPSLNDLHKLIVIHGGGFLQYLDGKTAVTHIIASSLTPKKRVEFRRYRIVKPAWVVESIKAGRLLPWDEFRVVDEGHGQQVLGFDNGKVVSQKNDQQTGYRDQTDASWYTSEILQSNSDPNSLGHVSVYPETHQSSTEGQGPVEEEQSVMSEFSLSDQARSTSIKAPQFGPEPYAHEAHGAASLAKVTSILSTDEAQECRDTGHVSYEPWGSEFVDDVFLNDFLEDPEFGPNPSLSPHSEPNSEFGSGQNEDNPAIVPDTLKRTYSSDTALPSKKVKMTAEEHNSVLLADPHFRKSSAVNPDFIRQYYSESRLHHLSTWKADLKSKLQQMTAEQSLSQKARQKRSPGARRYILHVDFDSFFAAVSLKSAPQYIDKPVVVAHGTGRGSEIASCNYPAREFGVKNGMWMRNALELCPQLKVLPYDFKAYEETSKEFYNVLLETGGIVQSVSVDEALVDISMFCQMAGQSGKAGEREEVIQREQAKADEVAGSIREAVKSRTGCAVSVGIGANILLAKVALRKAKPAGQHQIKPEEVLDYIGDLAIRDLPGVARSIGGKLEELGVKAVKDVRSLSKERLASVLGPKTGEKIWDYSRGVDNTEVGEQTVRKSVSAEVNWGIRFETQAQADEFVTSLCGELCKRLIEQRVKGKQLTMKIKRRAADAPLEPQKHLGHGKCDDFNRSVMLGVATNTQDVLAKESLSLLKAFAFSPGELRGIGLQMTKLEPLKVIGEEGVAESGQRRLEFKAANSTRSLMPGEDRTPSDDANLERENHEDIKFSTILGTQFAMPTQVDPAVLAELPPEIRARFATSQPRAISKASASDKGRLRSRSPSLPPSLLPAQSQLDQETLAALPEDVKQEVLAAYQKGPGRVQGQSLLPQSPRKARQLVPTSKKITTPTKKRAGLLSRGRGGKTDSNLTLTQSNFVAKPLNPSRTTEQSGSGTDDGHSLAYADNISAGFLEALPEDIRREVLAEHKRERLKRRGNLNVSSNSSSSRTQRLRAAAAAAAGESSLLGQRRLRLAPQPAKATFTTQKLSTLPELRDAISAWVSEFADDGPYDDDVRALAKYLTKVVTEGRKEMDKAVAVVRWLEWVVRENELVASGKGKTSWDRARMDVKDAVQNAVRERGLGPVEF